MYAGSEAEIVDFEELSEKAEEVEQADLEAKQAEFRENNPDVVADFRARTEELFHSLDGQSAEDIEKTVYAYVQSQIDEYGLDAKIVDVVVADAEDRKSRRVLFRSLPVPLPRLSPKVPQNQQSLLRNLHTPRPAKIHHDNTAL